jgi:hypothetical protein
MKSVVEAVVNRTFWLPVFVLRLYKDHDHFTGGSMLECYRTDRAVNLPEVLHNAFLVVVPPPVP